MKNSCILKIFFVCLTYHLTQFYSDAHTLVYNSSSFHEDMTKINKDVQNSSAIFHGSIPQDRTRTCNKGVSYRIVNVSDLVSNKENLECIFFSGFSPSKVPEGFLVGTVIASINNQGLNSILNHFWTGKTIAQIKCQTVSNVYTGSNKVLFFPIIPFISQVGPITINLTTGEYNDGKDVVLLDYRQRPLQDPCATAGHLDPSKEKPIANIFPINQVVDVIRFVGRQDNGSSIFLGKTYFLNKFTGNYSTILYFSLTNPDLEVNPDFLAGQALPPLETSFSYTNPVL